MRLLANLTILILLGIVGFHLAAAPVDASPHGQEDPGGVDAAGQSDSDASIVDPQVDYQFGEQISFQVQIQPAETQVSEMIVFITPEGSPTVWEKMDVDSEGAATAQVDARRLPLSPFQKVNYRFEARLADGRTISSDSYWFEYEDNRFDWQSQKEGIYEVYWYGDDLTLGQEILNITQMGLESAQSILAADPPDPLRIYAYTSSRDLQSALQLTSQSWVAGHANPEQGMILISVPSGPEKKLELERQIPHEIAHILQYRMIGSDFFNQPVWLIEGMASLAELYPNPEYRRVLEATTSADQVIPFNELCPSFPRDANIAFRAYAQSESFVRFLYEKYGEEKLHELIDQYHDGLACEEGFLSTYDVSLEQAEYRWKQEVLGIDARQLALQNLSPYLLLGLLVIIPASLALFPHRAQKNNEQNPEK